MLLAYGKPCDQHSSITVVYLGSFDTNYNNICRNLENFQKNLIYKEQNFVKENAESFGIFHLDMESLKLISIRWHMDYTNVKEKSEFQLHVGFWIGLLQVEVCTSIEFIHPWHSLLNCDDEVSQFILLVLVVGSSCHLSNVSVMCARKPTLVVPW